MSGRTVDDRVVRLQFDNAQFERNVRTSMSTLDRLKNALKFKGVGKGFDNINKSVKNVKMDHLSKGIEDCKSRFSALEVMGVTALANITNSAVNAGKKMLSALTLDPIMSGFEEYELKINSIQTIMSNTASKGTTMDQVTAVLDELNTYADKTIYNFAEMTRNIGTFTAAGVGLEDSAAAIQGIANLAAASGSNSQQASTAMYQLSQALAAGTVKLMDWNSVVNAGMGGEKFQLALKETAREYGINVDALIEKNGSFRESLQEGWLSADVLNDTLKKFTVEGATEYSQAMMDMGLYTQEQANALIAEAQNMEDAATKVKTFTQLWDTMKESVQSGWAQSWELIIGNFEEARVTLSELAGIFDNFIQAGANARNAMLTEAMTSKWSQLASEIEHVGIDLDVFKAKAIEVGIAHGAVTQEMIDQAGSFEESLKSGWLSPELFNEAIQGFKDAAVEMGASTDQMEAKIEAFRQAVDTAFDGTTDFEGSVQRLADAGYDYAESQDLVNQMLDGTGVRLEDLNQAQMEALGFTQEEIIAMTDLGEQALTAGSSINDLASNLDKMSGRELLFESLKNSILAIMTPLQAIKDAWNETFGVQAGGRLYSMLESLHSFTASLVMSEETADKLRRTFAGLFSILDIGVTAFGKVAKAGIGLLTGFVKGFNLTESGILTMTAALGDQIKAFHDWLMEGGNMDYWLGEIGGKLQIAADMMKQWAIEFYNLPQVQKVVQAVTEAANEMLDAFTAHFQETGNNLKGFVERVKAMGTDIHLDDLANIFRDFKNNVLKPAFNIDEIVGAFKNQLANFRANFQANFEAIGNVISTVVEKLTAFFDLVKSRISQNANIGNLLGIGIGASSIAALLKFTKVLDLLEGPIGAVTKVINNFGDVLNNFGSVLKSFSLQVKAKAMMTIAKSILVLAAALAVISYINPDRLGASVAVLIGLAGGLTLLAFAFSKMDMAGGMSKSAAGLLALSAGLILIASAMKIIGDMNIDQLVRSVVAIGTMMAALVASMIVMSKGDVAFSKGGFFILGFALAVKALASAMQDISNLNLADIAKGLLVLGTTLFGLAKVASIGNLGVAGLGLLAMAGGLLILVGALKMLAKIDPGDLAVAMMNLIPVMVAISALFLATHLAGAYAIQAGGFALMISAAMILLAGAITIISSIPQSGIEKATKAIAGLMVVMGLVVTLSFFAGEHAAKAGVMLLLMSGAILILGAVITVLSQLDPAGVARGTAAIVALEAAFALIIFVSEKAKGAQKDIVAITVCIALLAAAIAALSLIEPKNLASATIALGSLMGMFALIEYASKFAKMAWKEMGIMLLVVGSLAGLVALLSQLPVEASLGNAAAISLLMTTMSISMIAISKMGPVSMKAIGALALMGTVVAEIAGILTALEILQVELSLKNVIAISAMMYAMSGLMGILSFIGPVADKALIGALAFDGFIAIIGGLMVAIGALTKYFPQLKQFADEGIEMMTKIGNFIGSFVGSIAGGLVGGFGEAASSHLPAIGDSLSKFMESVQPFLDAAKNIEPGSLDGVEKLFNSLYNIVKGGILESLTKAFTGESSLSAFGDELQPFAEDLVSFSNSFNGFNEEAINKVAQATTMLTDLANAIPRLGGLAGGLIGEKSLAEFGKDLVPFAESLTLVSATAGGINVENCQKIAEAGKAIASIYDVAPRLGGLAAAFAGSKSLTMLATDLGPFVDGLSDASVRGAAISVENCQKVAEAGKAIAELQDSVPRIGGLAGALAGNKDLGKLGESMQPLINGLKAVNAAADEIDPAKIDVIVQASQKFSDILSALPDDGLLTNETWLADFGTDIKKFGDKFSEFAKSFQDVDTSNINAALPAVTKLAEIATQLNGVDLSGLSDFADIINDPTKFEEFGTNLKQLCDVLNDVAADCTGISLDGITILGQAVASFSAIGEGLHVEDLVTKFSNVGDFYLVGLGIKTLTLTLKDLANTGKDIDTAGLETTLAAIKSLITLVNTLPADIQTVGGSGGFGNFSALGAQLKTFVDGLNPLIEAAKDVSPEQLQAIATAISPLIDLAARMGGVDTANLQNFVNAIKELSQINLDEFASSIENSSNKIATAVNTMMQQFSQSIDTGSATVSLAMTRCMDGLVAVIEGHSSRVTFAMDSVMKKLADGITINASVTTTAVNNIMNPIISSITAKESAFRNAGVTIGKAFKDAFNKEFDNVGNEVAGKLTAVVGKIRAEYGSFMQAGVYLIDGLAAGMQAAMVKAIMVAAMVGRAVAASAKAALQINSPSKVFMEIGKFTVMGLANGLRDNTKLAKDAAIKMASGVITSMQDELKIHSPSIVARDEVGKYIIEGIAEGIEENMDAEQAAQQKAQNIIDAFQSELDKYAKTWDMADLQFELYKALNKDVVGEHELAYKEYEYTQAKMTRLAETVALAEGKYRTMVETFGEASQEAYDAKTEWLQAQIDLANLANDQKEQLKNINELREEYNEASANGLKLYQKELESLLPAMQVFGYTFEQLDQIARERTGWQGFQQKLDPIGTTTTIQQMVNTAMKNTAGTYAEYSKTSFGTALEEFSKNGKKLSEATATGVDKAAPAVENSAEKAAEAGSDTIKSEAKTFEEAGKTVGQAFASGLESMVPAAEAASQKIVEAAKTATNGVQNLGETIKKTIVIGSAKGDSGKTIWNDFDEYGKTLNKGIGQSGKPTIEGTSITIASVGSLNLTGKGDYVPANIGTAWSSTSSDIAKNINNALVENKTGGSLLANPQPGTVVNNYNMTQNNTSPKALNASEIYRDTKTLFSKVKKASK